MADKQITPFQLTDQFTMDNFNQRINETNTALQNKAPSGYGYDGANSSLVLLNFISGDTVDDKLTTLFNSMINNSAVQICLSDASFSGYEMHGTLYKLSNYHGGYATAVFNGYDNYAGIPVTVRKVLREGVWGPYEYFTPPMLLGKEYRTTERYQGKPVYVKAVDCGAMPASKSKNVAHGIKNISGIVSCTGYFTYNKSVVSLPYARGTVTNVGSIWASETDIVVWADNSNYTNYNAYGIIKCTKTTD